MELPYGAVRPWTKKLFIRGVMCASYKLSRSSRSSHQRSFSDVSTVLGTAPCTHNALDYEWLCFFFETKLLPG